MERIAPSRDLSPLSRYGDRRDDDLTLGITLGAPASRQEGFTDLSRLNERDRSCSGQLRSLLPDKEFRYLRTVIVTAAVYRGFGSELLGRTR